MTRELWKGLEHEAVNKGVFSKGGREYIKEEGRQEGLQRGLQQGIQKGWREERQQVVLNMLKEKADLSFVCKVTGLSEEEIKKLQNGK